MADRAFLDRLARELADSGQPIAAGFIAARLTGFVPADATPEQLELARTMFMAGAQHLWATMFGFLDEGVEETPNDMRRMGIVDSELERWYEVQAKKHGLPLRRRGKGRQ